MFKQLLYYKLFGAPKASSKVNYALKYAVGL